MRPIVITACTNRKRFPPGRNLRARQLATGALEDVLQDWLCRVDAADDRVPADRLYCGRAFAEAKWVAEAAGGRLLIVSAGLGLLEADTLVPSYSLTVLPDSADSVLQRFDPRATASAWWTQITARSSLSNCLTGVACSRPPGLILLALPSLYLHMVEEEVLGLPEDVWARLRIFGLGIRGQIDSRLEPSIMPYDGRLDDPRSPIRGTRSDFASRALRHFVATVLAEYPTGSADQHRAAVESTLAGWQLPTTPRRPRLSDEQVLGLIRAHWDDANGQSSRMLRLLRDRLAVACEQGRFRTLFHKVRLDRGAQP